MLIVGAEIEGRPGQRIRVQAERIVEVGPWLRRRASEEELNAGGGAVIAGLHDHHVHLRSAAAAMASVALDSQTLERSDSWAATLREASGKLPAGRWLRGVGISGAWADTADRWTVDAALSDRPVRLQHRTGELWVLNSAAVLELGVDLWDEVGVERTSNGTPTGRLWRLDERLRRALGASQDNTTELRRVSDRALRFGITGFTDATPGLTGDGLHALEAMVDSGVLRQRVTAMAGAHLRPVASGSVPLGACKIVLDDATLPAEAEFAATIRASHSHGVPIAIHCVTAAQLVVAVSAIASAGSWPGDRIEHAGVVPTGYAAVLARLGVTVVTQPGFVFARGDDYLREVTGPERDWLYPCASLRSAGVPVAAGSDAPFGPLDPWAAMRTAVTRQTVSGAVVGTDERIGGAAALALYLGEAADPGRPRRVVAGELADLCILRQPMSHVLSDLGAHQVAGVLVRGEAHLWDA